MGERRAQLSALDGRARHLARRDRHASVEPLAGPADHRHAALPPERRAPPLRRLAEQHLRAARPRRDPRRRPCDRRPGRPAAVPAAPARAVRQLAARRGRQLAGSTPRARRSSRACSRAAACRTPTATGQGYEAYVRHALRDGLDRRAHADLVERPAAPRLPDGRDPHLRRAARPGRVAGAGAATATRSPRGSRARVDEGEPLPDPPPADDRGEHVAGDPVRDVRDAARSRDVRGAPGARRARAGGGVDRAGRRRARCPADRSRQPPPPSARSPGAEEGWSLEDIYAEQVRASEPVRG